MADTKRTAHHRNTATTSPRDNLIQFPLTSSSESSAEPSTRHNDNLIPFPCSRKHIEHPSADDVVIARHLVLAVGTWLQDHGLAGSIPKAAFTRASVAMAKELESLLPVS